MVRTPRCWDEVGRIWGGRERQRGVLGTADRPTGWTPRRWPGRRARARAGNGLAPARSTVAPGGGIMREKKKMGGARAAEARAAVGRSPECGAIGRDCACSGSSPSTAANPLVTVEEAIGCGRAGERIGRPVLSSCLTICRNSRSGRCERGYVGARVLSSVPRVRDPRTAIDTRS